MFHLTRPHDQRAMRFYWWGPLMVSHDFLKFGGHNHCGKADMFLVVEE